MNSLDFPLQDFFCLAANERIVDVAKYSSNWFVDKLLHGIKDVQVSNITGMPYFIAITQMVTHSLVPVAVGI